MSGYILTSVMKCTPDGSFIQYQFMLYCERKTGEKHLEQQFYIKFSVKICKNSS